MVRRLVVCALAGGLLALACGGGLASTLHTKGSPKGQGAVDFAIENRSGATINNLFIAPSEAVAKVERDPALLGEELWGDDRLPGNALEDGGVAKIDVAPGRYDVKAVDHDGRYQHVAGLKIVAGGRYVLELGDASWRVPH